MCGKNIYTSAVVSGVNEVPTYVRTYSHMLAHRNSGEKLMIMIFESLSTFRFLTFASEFLLLVTWIVVEGQHVCRK
jgi:hypothetical protein